MADETTERKLLSVLRKSFDMLPSENHRLMFLDAALMLRGCPHAHLLTLWEAALLYHADEIGWSLQAKRKLTDSNAQWQTSRRTAAARIAKAQLKYLLDTCLVGVTTSSGNR